MFDFRFEPTITEIMREPMVRALMKADRVDATAFEAHLRLMAGGDAADPEGDDEAEDAVSAKPRFVPQAAARGVVERCCWC